MNKILAEGHCRFHGYCRLVCRRMSFQLMRSNIHISLLYNYLSVQSQRFSVPSHRLTGFPQPNLQLIRKHLQFDQLFEQFMSIQKRCAAKRLIAPKSSRGVSSTEMISSNKAERSPANLKSSVHDHASPFVVGSPTDYLTQVKIIRHIVQFVIRYGTTVRGL